MYSIEQMTKIYRFANVRSFWRGFDYANNGYAKVIKKIDDTHYECEVSGSREEPYHVVIDVEKIKKSTCDCPKNENNPTYFCKHKVAAYFAIFKEEFNNAKKFIEQIEKENLHMQDEYYAKLEKAELEVKAQVEKEVANLSNEEAKEKLAVLMRHDKMKEIERDLYNEYEDYLNFDYEED